MTSTTVAYHETTRGIIELNMRDPPAVIYEWRRDGSAVQVGLVARPDTRIEGVVESFDEHMNLVLRDAFEIRVALGNPPTQVSRRELGRIMLKGDTVGWVCDKVDHPLDPPPVSA
eukprot:TRINITY_DN18491_c0_g1_i1.p2 TRINITY_DN18491_c0_g1~~TRINITY_DN18491_c0_g1_i1.p2  ORF type:complete len:115 (-),score=13.37 TRINITY_DN18491_c0_g1_i1:111-455(-)